METTTADDLSNQSEKIIFFDGQCNLCSRTVVFLINNHQDANFKFSSLQSNAAASLLPTHAIPDNDDIFPKTIVFLNHGTTLIRSQAVEAILVDLGGRYRMMSYLAKLLPLFLKDVIYDFIARNRYSWFGTTEFCYVPTESQKTLFLD